MSSSLDNAIGDGSWASSGSSRTRFVFRWWLMPTKITMLPSVVMCAAGGGEPGQPGTAGQAGTSGHTVHVNPGQVAHEGHRLAQMVRARANSSVAAAGQDAHIRWARRETDYRESGL
eukprot:11843470-Heterocapsa_arctica.AAC.1